MKVRHILKPIYNQDSKILILGTIPSPKSREIGFYYGHPQNRFWKVISDILNEKYPETKKEKTNMILTHHIALWDVLKSCNIEGASDSSIKNARPNDLNKIIKNSNIQTIFVTGKTAEKLYNKFCKKETNISCIYLPSTSPANCSLKYEDLKKQYKIILKYL